MARDNDAQLGVGGVPAGQPNNLRWWPQPIQQQRKIGVLGQNDSVVEARLGEGRRVIGIA